jgi:hypothetical protein
MRGAIWGLAQKFAAKLGCDLWFRACTIPLVLRRLLLSNASHASVSLVVQYLSCSGESYCPNTFGPPVRLVVQNIWYLVASCAVMCLVPRCVLWSRTTGTSLRLVLWCFLCRGASCGPENEVPFLLISYKYYYLLCDAYLSFCVAVTWSSSPGVLLVHGGNSGSWLVVNKNVFYFELLV